MRVPTQAIIGTGNEEYDDGFTHLRYRDIALIKTREQTHQLFFALLLTHYQRNLNFHLDTSLILPSAALRLSETLKVPNIINIPSKRSLADYRKRLRVHFNMTAPTKQHYQLTQNWLVNNILSVQDLSIGEIQHHVNHYLQQKHIEFFTEKTMQRLIQSSINKYEVIFFQMIASLLTPIIKTNLDSLLLPKPDQYILTPMF
ncbi:MAG: DUF4158 domain-containing protein [Gammaproteobacteria bacterium]|nr:DUF4158 domain-containing protein [Gammaproteobacteria bacterium]